MYSRTVRTCYSTVRTPTTIGGKRGQLNDRLNTAEPEKARGEGGKDDTSQRDQDRHFCAASHCLPQHFHACVPVEVDRANMRDFSYSVNCKIDMINKACHTYDIVNVHFKKLDLPVETHISVEEDTAFNPR